MFGISKKKDLKSQDDKHRFQDFRSLPVAAFAVDREGRIVWWNDRVAALTGRTENEMRASLATAAFSNGRTPLPTDDALKSNRMVADDSFVISHRNAQDRKTVRFSAGPILDEDGEQIGALATLEEKEEVKQVDSNRDLHLIPTPIMKIDRNYNVLFLNKSGADVVGLTPETAVGKKCYDLFKTPHCNTSECRCRQAMEQRVIRNGETVADPNGINVPIRYTGAPLTSEDGELIGAVEFVIDISEEKKAMEEAQLKVDYLNRIPTPVMTIDTDMNVIFMNPAAAGAVGKTSDEVKGLKCFNLFNTAHCNTAECQVKKAMNTGQVSTSDTIARLPSGDLPIRYSGAPLYDGHGKIIGGLEYVLDISKEYAVTDGVSEVAEAAINGQLSARIDETEFEGNYKRIVTGFNSTLDAVVQPITEAAGVLEQLSNYDLTARVTGEYMGDHAKIKESLNATASALQESLMQVREAVNQVNSAAQQISISSQQVAEGASEQASALEETTSSMEEMSGMTKQNADNTLQAKSLSESTKKSAQKGTAEMERMLDAMGKIKTAAQRTAEIIKDINDIAFQTNLLALNAAVEAARAGDAGRGFAVVAEEVRNLAGRAKDAAQNTERLIKESVSLAEGGQQISADVSTNLGEMAVAVEKVTSIIAEIAVASAEQSRGIEQVNKAMVEMDQVTQRSAANSEESSSAAEELAGQAQELAAMIGKFHLGNDSRRIRATSPVIHDSQKRHRRQPASNGIGAVHHEMIPMDDDQDFAEF
ncbi:MAG: PAS domain-containing protein [Deltaproteobacteria bacterium]|nr:PAS domain-containing protein [Deltaproteobacteria bacterium]